MRSVRFAGLLGVALVAGAVGGCVDEQLVYRDKPMFEDPPQAAVGFLGYSNIDQKQTVCGNCHAGQQAVWKESAHADAWKDLQASGHAADTCNGCHTVGKLGNAATAVVGYDGVKDARYQDVQCESCHGAGADHIVDPSIDAKKPLATMHADSSLTNGCGECHAGSHHPFVAEWQGSRHARVDDHVASRAYATDYMSCAPCHDGKVMMKQTLKLTNNFLERDDTTKIGVTCIVCHDPHGNGKPAQLRMLATSHDPATNLCAQCHKRYPTPTGTTSRNYPHAAQGYIVFGEVGYKPPGFPTDKIIGTHGSSANEGACVTCHMATWAINATTNTTGHTFEAIPCPTAAGGPSNATDCTMSQRIFKSCVGGGCHGTEGAARSATIAAETRLTNLSTELKRLVALARLTPKGIADWKSDTNVTPLEGADFNSQIMEHDLSRGAHNPFLVDALLNSSISYIKTYYGVQ